MGSERHIPLSIGDSVRPWALRTPTAVAVRHGERELTYAGIVERMNRVGNAALDGLGLAPGEHAGIFTPNRLEYLELMLGLADARIPPAQLPPTLTATELETHCAEARIRVLFVDPSLEEQARAAELDDATRLVVLGEEYENLLSLAGSSRPEVPRRDDDLCLIRYTSGTTGTPKAAGHSHRSRALQNLAMGSEMGFSSAGERALTVGSLSAGAGLLHAYATLRAGGTCVMLPIFNPELVLRQIERMRVTSVTAVPSHLQAIVELGEATLAKYDTSSLRLANLIGSSAPPELKERLVSVLGDGVLWVQYGSTEASIVTSLTPEDQLRKPLSAGLPFYGNVLKIVSDDGTEAAAEETGVLHVRSPLLFEGYWNRPEATAASFADGFFVTGDLARRDEEGYLYILARTDDTIITGGLNVDPEPIEELLRRHPGVADAAVFGVPDTRLGEAICAAVVVRPGADHDEPALARHLARELIPAKRPRRIEFVEELPHTESGKLARSRLRSRFGAEETRR
ncbi:MAG TPA: class I adenylate-forming enzyme family protein [Gaiellaceae bacterium]|nr:class I adenylate-forming enzyme family protein [Gaiellaceae bacterium]